MAVSGVDIQLQQLQISTAASLTAITERTEQSISTLDSSVNSNAFQREFSIVKKQNDQIKDINEQLTLEVNELKVKLKLAEDRIKSYEEYLQQVQSKSIDQTNENHSNDQEEDHTEISQALQSSGNNNNKARSRNRQILMNFQKENEENLQKKVLHAPQRHCTAEPKPNNKHEQHGISPFGRQKNSDFFELYVENYNNTKMQQDTNEIYNKPREGSVTSPAKKTLARQDTQEQPQDNKFLCDQQVPTTNQPLAGGIRLQKVMVGQQDEVKQVKVEKTDQIVAVGYQRLKEGSQFKPQAHLAMLKNKKLRRIQNNSSQDINFIMKEQRILNFKNNIEQKTFSQNLYGNQLQAQQSEENSDFFMSQQISGQGANQVNIIYSEHPSQTNLQSSGAQQQQHQNNSNSKDNSNNTGNSNNSNPNSSSGTKVPNQIQGNIFTQSTPLHLNNNQNNVFNLATANSAAHQNANNLFNISKLNHQVSQAPPQSLTSLPFIPISKQTSLNAAFGNTPNNVHNNGVLNQSVDQNPLSSNNDIDMSALNSEDSNLKSIIVVSEQDPEIAKYEAECNRFYSLYQDMIQFGTLGDFLFEEFMVIGPDLKELHALVEEHPSPFTGIKGASMEYTKGKAQQTILFSQPSYISPMVCQKRQCVAQFAFPQGLQYYRYRSQTDLQNIPPRFKDILLLNLCQQKESGVRDNMFVLNIRGEDSNVNTHNSLQAMNPNQIMYAICYQQEDILVVTDEKTGEKTIFLFPTVYCFLTYYPFVDYFLSIILEIVNRIKTIRLVKSSFSGIIDNNLQNADLEQVIKTLQRDRDLILSLKVLQIREVIPDKVISHYLSTPQPYLFLPEDHRSSHDERDKTPANQQFITLSYRVPPIEEMIYIEGMEAAYLSFSNLPFYDFQMILTLIMLEKKVVFLSKNITLLTLTTLTFQTLFKPMKYPHPIIFSISEDLMYFLEAPVPIIVGINTTMEKFEYENGLNNECYYIDLDKNCITTKNNQTISKIESMKYRFMNQKSQIKILFNEINNGITSKQLGNKFKKLLQRSHHDKKLVYRPDIRQQTILKTLIYLIRKSFQESIIQKLPLTPIFLASESQTQLDMAEIQKAVLKDNPESAFLSSFVETQLFYYFIEQRYF